MDKMKVTIHKGVAYEPHKDHPFPYEDDYYTTSDGFRKDLYDKKLSVALSHAAEFEDQEFLKSHLRVSNIELFENGNLKDGTYEADLPPTERVYGYVGDDGTIVYQSGKEAHDFIKSKMPHWKFVTVVRFVKESEPLSPQFNLKYCEKCIQMTNHDLEGACLKCKVMKDSSIPDQPKQKTIKIGVVETRATSFDAGQGKQAGLHPCPFCGHDAEWINEALEDDHYYIRCSNGECHIMIKADRRDKAIGLWNGRVKSQPSTVAPQGEHTESIEEAAERYYQEDKIHKLHPKEVFSLGAQWAFEQESQPSTAQPMLAEKYLLKIKEVCEQSLNYRVVNPAGIRASIALVNEYFESEPVSPSEEEQERLWQEIETFEPSSKEEHEDFKNGFILTRRTKTK